MKKKVVAALLTTAMVLSMGACGTKDGGNTTDGGNEGGGESKGYEFEILVKSFQSTILARQLFKVLNKLVESWV